MDDRHDHKKQWEEYYHLFLLRYTNQGMVVHKKALVARLSGTSPAGSNSLIPRCGGREGGREEGRGGGGGGAEGRGE